MITHPTLHDADAGWAVSKNAYETAVLIQLTERHEQVRVVLNATEARLFLRELERAILAITAEKTDEKSLVNLTVHYDEGEEDDGA